MLKNLRFTWTCQQHFAFDSNNIDNNFIHKWSFQTVSNLISFCIMELISFSTVRSWMELFSLWFDSKAEWYWIYRLDLKILLKCHVHVDMAKMARRNLWKRLYWDISFRSKIVEWDFWYTICIQLSLLQNFNRLQNRATWMGREKLKGKEEVCL